MHDAPVNQPLAYLDGRWIPADQAAVPVSDAGFVWGATVAERLRTFGGRLFRLEAHLARLERSLDLVGIESADRLPHLCDLAEELVRRNHALLATGDDLGLVIFVTPGDTSTLSPGPLTEPRIGLYTYPLPFQQWAAKYASGEALAVSEIEQVSPRSWPPELKCRSRMHYYLADREAARQQPPARALLLSQDGYLTETSAANVVLFLRDEGLVSPRSDQILPGVSLAYAAELAAKAGIPFGERSMTPGDLAAAEEILLTSTPWCILPVTSVDGRPVGSGQPGPVFTRLATDWSRAVDEDIVAQAARFAVR